MTKQIKKNHWASKFINEPKIPIIFTEFGHKKVETEDDIKKLYKLYKTSFSENEFLTIVNIINKNGGKVKKNGLIKLNIKVMNEIIDKFKITTKDINN